MLVKHTSITPIFVEQIPESLEDGNLYISRRYSTALHKCYCGCGAEVVTPLTQTDWSLEFDGKSVSLAPSIGNWSLPCRSHYIIRKNRVQWVGAMTQQQIEKNRTVDRAIKNAYYNKHEDLTSRSGSVADQAGKPVWTSLWRKFLKWLAP